MSGPALDYTYRYAFASEVVATPQGNRLRLATCGGAAEQPYFFQGRLTRPQRTADLLRGLVQIVQSRFDIPPAMLARILLAADPVVTSSEDVLRFEAFSACCSTYARVDLLPAALDGAFQERGTTNVDFNASMRAALARIRDADLLPAITFCTKYGHEVLHQGYFTGELSHEVLSQRQRLTWPKCPRP